jgi:ATP-dependent RNA helicase RhlE
MNFEELRLHPALLLTVQRLGYKEPTAIQAQAIPRIMEGKDILGQAQTGTGKTAAFVLPILHSLANKQRGTIRALILAPTRELAQQIHDAITDLSSGTGVRSAVVYGGVGMGPQVEKLRKKPDIVVACPGRLLDHHVHRTIDLTRIETLVLDEADRMLDMGFLPDIRRVITLLPRQRQTMLFSATIPQDIRQLAKDFMKDPIAVSVGIIAPAESVYHALYPVPQHLKTNLLIELLRKTDTGSVIIFTRTKFKAKRVGRDLQLAGFRAISLQGNLSQSKRQEAMDGFRKGKYQILVATDIAARGIDVSTISHVINYDMPDTTDAYIHRIGRTGRVDRTGDAFTLVTGEDEMMARSIERVLGSRLERRQLEGFDYGSYARESRSPPPQRQMRPGARRGHGPARAMRDPFAPTPKLYQSSHRDMKDDSSKNMSSEKRLY